MITLERYSIIYTEYETLHSDIEFGIIVVIILRQVIYAYYFIQL